MQEIGRRSRSGDAEKVCFNPAKVQGKIMFATSTPRKICLLSCSSASIVETNPSSLIIFFAEGGEKYYKYFVMDVRKSEEIRVKLKAMTYTFGMTLSHNIATAELLFVSEGLPSFARLETCNQLFRLVSSCCPRWVFL